MKGGGGDLCRSRVSHHRAAFLCGVNKVVIKVIMKISITKTDHRLRNSSHFSVQQLILSQRK